MDYANRHVWEVMSDQDQESGWYKLLLTLMLHSTVEIFSPLSAQAFMMPTNDQQIQMRANTEEANGGCRKRK